MRLMWMILLSGFMVNETVWGMPQKKDESCTGSLKRTSTLKRILSFKKDEKEKAILSLGRYFKKAFPKGDGWFEMHGTLRAHTNAKQKEWNPQNCQDFETFSQKIDGQNFRKKMSRESCEKEKEESKTWTRTIFTTFDQDTNPAVLQYAYHMENYQDFLSLPENTKAAQTLWACYMKRIETTEARKSYELCTIRTELHAGEKYQSLEAIKERAQTLCLLSNDPKDFEKLWARMENCSQRQAVNSFFSHFIDFTNQFYPDAYAIYKKQQEPLPSIPLDHIQMIPIQVQALPHRAPTSNQASLSSFQSSIKPVQVVPPQPSNRSGIQTLPRLHTSPQKSSLNRTHSSVKEKSSVTPGQEGRPALPPKTRQSLAQNHSQTLGREGTPSSLNHSTFTPTSSSSLQRTPTNQKNHLKTPPPIPPKPNKAASVFSSMAIVSPTLHFSEEGLVTQTVEKQKDSTDSEIQSRPSHQEPAKLKRNNTLGGWDEIDAIMSQALKTADSFWTFSNVSAPQIVDWEPHP